MREQYRQQYRRFIEREVLGMPIRDFVYDYKVVRQEPRISVSRRTGIPVSTLRVWEETHLEKETTYRLREPVAPGR